MSGITGPGQLALLFVDLDRFKQANDTMGHAAGDVILVEVARRLRAVVRSGDLIGRLGGDEFAVALIPATQQDALDVAQRIVTELSRPYSVPGGRVEVGASVGIALNTDAGEDDLVERADVAMYEAKRAGRGCFVMHRPGSGEDPRALVAQPAA
jgi:diguanylate cyclase